jgi:hypothetical protein
MPYIRKRWPNHRAPRFDDVALNFTFQCNLSCVGCDRASFIKPQHSPPMTPERLEAFFDEVRSAGITLKKIRIVGGEPTLHPDFLSMTDIVMDYVKQTNPNCIVNLFSNKHIPLSIQLEQQVVSLYPSLRALGAVKKKSWVFPKMTRYEYVSPKDAGISCPHPCPNMSVRGNCGHGVDQVGYAICPTAVVIDSILQLGARATTVKQMIYPEFVQWQTKTICSQCGNFMAYKPHELPQLWDCNGTPVSKRYHEKVSLLHIQGA